MLDITFFTPKNCYYTTFFTTNNCIAYTQKESILDAETQLAFLEELEEQIMEAAHAYSKADEEMKEKLKHAETWQQTYPYNYVMKMNGMY